MAVENANLVHAMASFTAANPPVLISSSGVRRVTRSNTGQYVAELEQPVPYAALVAPGSQCRGTYNGTPTAGIASAFVDADGNAFVEVRGLNGTLGDLGGRVDLVVLRYPTQS
jgi:hypothetical protein